MDKYLITPAEAEELATRFTYHAPHGNQAQRFGLLRDHALMFAECLLEHAPPSDERELAVRHVEAAVMWANAAIARRENHVPATPARDGPPGAIQIAGRKEPPM